MLPFALLALAALAAPEVADLVYATGFETGAEGWRAYDNWGKPEFGCVETSPLGAGPALRVAFDDTSTVAHFDKGFTLFVPEPVPWALVDFIAARYHVDQPVANLRVFVHDDQGGWWDCTRSQPVIGQPAEVLVERGEFRLAWTDDANQPAPDRTGRITSVFVSVHNLKPVNSGERFVVHLDDVQIGTALLPLPQPLAADAPPLTSWPTARLERRPGEDPRSWRGAVAVPTAAGPAYRAQVGDAAVTRGSAEGERRTPLVRALTPVEALGLSFRTGAATWVAEGQPVAGQPVRVRLLLPAPWADAELAASLAGSAGQPVPLAVAERRPVPGGVAVTLASAADADVPLGRAIARLELRLDGETLAVTAPVAVAELDRTALAADGEAATQRAEALAQRVAGQRGEPGWAKEPLTSFPRVLRREPVDPARWSQVPDAVTWDDLGARFLGGAQCGTSEEQLRLFFDHHRFGNVIKPHLGAVFGGDWQATLRRLAERNLVVTSIWGYVPDSPWNGGFGEFAPTPEQHQALVDTLGRRFLGYEMGEQDGRYVGSYAPRYQPADRAEAKRLFSDWHERILATFDHRMVSLNSLNFLHDAARQGHRMIGIEASQGLPSDTMQWAFVRGASKQWGVLTWNCISVYNRWGYKSYTSTGPDHGPDKGASESLLRRLWYATLMYGSAINMFESAYFTAEKDAEGFPQLSPVGQAHVDGLRWAEEHPDRGVLFTPVALMLDRDSGWVPPRHLYTARRHLVWGNLPYSRGDHAVDAFLRHIWPKYEDCSYYPDERGFLTATPFGDSFDVILSDAPAECLAQYQAVVLLGEVTVDDALRERLTRFVREGGELVADAAAARALGSELCGVTFGTERRAAQRSVVLPAGEALEELPYSYFAATPRGAAPGAAVAHALSDRGDGIVWSFAHGRGRVITCGVPNFVVAETDAPQPGVDVPLPHPLLGAFTATLDPWLRSLSFVRAEGDPVQVLTNVGLEPDRLVVTVINNETTPARVTLRSNAATPWRWCRPWLGEAAMEGEAMVLSLPPGELAVVAVSYR